MFATENIRETSYILQIYFKVYCIGKDKVRALLEIVSCCGIKGIKHVGDVLVKENRLWNDRSLFHRVLFDCNRVTGCGFRLWTSSSDLHINSMWIS